MDHETIFNIMFGTSDSADRRRALKEHRLEVAEAIRTLQDKVSALDFNETGKSILAAFRSS